MHGLDHIVNCVHSNLNQLKHIHSLEDAYASVTLRVTGAVLLTAFVMWISSGTAKKSTNKKATKSGRRKKGKKSKQAVKEVTPEERIDHVLSKFQKEYEIGFNQLLETYVAGEEKSEYQRNYYNEMLLHLLLDLDGVHLDSLEGDRKEAVRVQRKAAIKKIQLELKRLDQLQQN